LGTYLDDHKITSGACFHLSFGDKSYVVRVGCDVPWPGSSGGEPIGNLSFDQLERAGAGTALLKVAIGVAVVTHSSAAPSGGSPGVPMRSAVPLQVLPPKPSSEY